ncbi:hypothetical protein BCR35DRAFT_160725 [Leucosporidium creatinivorum]|uniref:Uncharacterized protein n=1 Tax=Leucosporidium creatinivorum TaxID=106004 RepID=A0A1Y2EMD7_9BASI|nr:hypothetical protein BCR35DRAFT_160725 [Leucosporidium creatinivorum]
MRDTQRLLGGDGAHAGSRSSQPPLLTAHSASLGGAVAGALLAMLLSGGGIALLWGDDDSLWTITLFCVSLVGWLIVMGVLVSPSNLRRFHWQARLAANALRRSQAAHFVELRGKQHKKGKVKTLFFLFTVR